MPVAMEAGKSPIAAAIAAINTGLNCSSAPRLMASRVGVPLRVRSCLMRDTRMTPPRTETPKSEMKPTAAEILKLVCVTSKARIPPMNASGTVPSRQRWHHGHCEMRHRAEENQHKTHRNDDRETVDRRLELLKLSGPFIVISARKGKRSGGSWPQLPRSCSGDHARGR